MLTIIVGAAATLIGILLGGGVRAWEASRNRRLEAEALLSALAAEVEAVTRLIHHRQFIPGMMDTLQSAQLQVAAGNQDDAAAFLVISLKQNYFAVFDASVGKLGLLHPYHADRIVRFYTYARAVQENYDPASPFQAGVTAAAAVEVLQNDLQLLHTVVTLGEHIATFRPAAPPQGVISPFLDAPPKSTEPALPPPNPAGALQKAGANPAGM